MKFELLTIFAPSNTPSSVIELAISSCNFKFKSILVPDTYRLPYNEIIKIAINMEFEYKTIDYSSTHTGNLYQDTYERLIIQADCAIIIFNNQSKNERMNNTLKLIRKYKLPYYLVRYNSKNKSFSGKHFKWN